MDSSSTGAVFGEGLRAGMLGDKNGIGESFSSSSRVFGSSKLEVKALDAGDAGDTRPSAATVEVLRFATLTELLTPRRLCNCLDVFGKLPSSVRNCVIDIGLKRGVRGIESVVTMLSFMLGKSSFRVSLFAGSKALGIAGTGVVCSASCKGVSGTASGGSDDCVLLPTLSNTVEGIW